MTRMFGRLIRNRYVLGSIDGVMPGFKSSHLGVDFFCIQYESLTLTPQCLTGVSLNSPIVFVKIMTIVLLDYIDIFCYLFSKHLAKHFLTHSAFKNIGEWVSLCQKTVCLLLADIMPHIITSCIYLILLESIHTCGHAYSFISIISFPFPISHFSVPCFTSSQYNG